MDSSSTDNLPAEKKKRSFLDRFKRDKPADVETLPETTPVNQPAPNESNSLRAKMQRALSRTSRGLGDLFLGSKTIDENIFDELETLLLVADVGIEATTQIIAELTERSNRSALKDGAALQAALGEILLERLACCEQLIEPVSTDGPFVILVVGVNGVGKTTTIGKLARRLQQQGKSVMLAAGDTFRAAAVEQLQVSATRFLW